MGGNFGYLLNDPDFIPFYITSAEIRASMSNFVLRFGIELNKKLAWMLEVGNISKQKVKNLEYLMNELDIEQWRRSGMGEHDSAESLAIESKNTASQKLTSDIPRYQFFSERQKRSLDSATTWDDNLCEMICCNCSTDADQTNQNLDLLTLSNKNVTDGLVFEIKQGQNLLRRVMSVSFAGKPYKPSDVFEVVMAPVSKNCIRVKKNFIQNKPGESGGLKIAFFSGYTGFGLQGSYEDITGTPSFSLFLDDKDRFLSGDEMKLVTGHQTSIGFTKKFVGRLSRDDNPKGTCAVKGSEVSVDECKRECAAQLILDGVCGCRLAWFETGKFLNSSDASECTRWFSNC